MELIENAKAFILGYYRQYKAEQGELQTHILEQAVYRSKICSDCMEAKKCKLCYCDLPARFLVDKPKYPCPYPLLMGKEEWEQFKKEHEL